jgi:nitrate reductase delta subunit
MTFKPFPDRRFPDRPFPDWAVAAGWQCASMLLDYPGSRDLSTVHAVLPHLPSQLRRPLTRVLAHLEQTPIGELQEEYVATFDKRRRCDLFLTYFTHGDTRKRGLALLRFKQAYQAAGVEPPEDELPDHLCVVLEFAASVDLSTGRQLLRDHRAGIEASRISLRDCDSPWAPLLDVVCAPLPALRGDERGALRRLAEQGSPAEEVGLTPYGTPAFDAALSAGPVDLPMLAVPAAGRGV